MDKIVIPASKEVEFLSRVATYCKMQRMAKTARQLNREIARILVPGIGKWNTYAGGTSAAEGKRSYDFYVPEGQYRIDPMSSHADKFTADAGHLSRFRKRAR